MIVIVDANIIFSALITPNGKLAQILTHPNLSAKRISCYYATVELFKHQSKIVKCSHKSLDEVIADLYDILTSMQLYNEALIEMEHWKEAERLTAGVDSFDISYVALALQTGGMLWTGDKKLVDHLHKMGFKQTVGTAELFNKLL
ncbi:PIN domain-containing protein [Dyadobacter sp. MSC1_007]|uniref:PIN domain-containing protein n=1 Tax=Dyadobacter sp. MSC1_007 TaxID=2909264 RepID=UPI00202F1EDF|nr:PIN domain-containing protein [Dyadobacter sp. MSC1_007]